MPQKEKAPNLIEQPLIQQALLKLDLKRILRSENYRVNLKLERQS